jgi:hypothetical protein
MQRTRSPPGHCRPQPTGWIPPSVSLSGSITARDRDRYRKYGTVWYMKTKLTLANRHTSARDLTLAKLAQSGPFLEGHLSQFKRPGCTTPGWHLTFKQKGRTRTVYVPMSLVPQVKEWTRNYKRLKKLIREVTRHSLALVRTHVANQRAAKRSQALTGP